MPGLYKTPMITCRKNKQIASIDYQCIFAMKLAAFAACGRVYARAAPRNYVQELNVGTVHVPLNLQVTGNYLTCMCIYDKA